MGNKVSYIFIYFFIQSFKNIGLCKLSANFHNTYHIYYSCVNLSTFSYALFFTRNLDIIKINSRPFLAVPITVPNYVVFDNVNLKVRHSIY